MKYFIVLFKNKGRKKIINKFKTFKRAEDFYNNHIKSNNVIFEKKFENGKPCNYELGLLEKSGLSKENYFIKDELGRQIKVESDSDFIIKKISNYPVEELIFDVFENKKITFDQFYRKYFKSKDLKLLSKVNNKVVLQENDVINLFSLKSEIDSDRFIDVVSKFMIDMSRTDVICVKDTSKAQKKYLYEVLSSMGVDKSKLYRRFTTFPR